MVIWLECECIDDIVGVWIEGSIKSTIRINTRDTIATDSSDGRELSSDKDFSVRLDDDCSDLVIWIWVPCGVKGSIRIETSEIVSRCSRCGGESSSDNNFSICLYSGSVDGIIDIGIFKGRLEKSTCIDFCHSHHWRCIYGSKLSCNNDARISKRRGNRPNRTVHPEIVLGIEKVPTKFCVA